MARKTVKQLRSDRDDRARCVSRLIDAVQARMVAARLHSDGVADMADGIRKLDLVIADYTRWIVGDEV